MKETRTVFWDRGQVVMIDQRVLPQHFVLRRFTTAQAVADAIRVMVVRGAPAIGAAAAFGLAVAAHKSKAKTVDALREELRIASEVLARSRPTAVNLFWAIERLGRVTANPRLETPQQLREALLAEAQRLADEDIAINQRMGANGAKLVPPNASIIHHCNTGALAAVGWGTALGVVRSAWVAGKNPRVLVDETRPRLQGARLTSWELKHLGIDHLIIADGASGHYMRRTKVDLCLVGADRIAANGDTANKIGTYNLAVVARANKVPFYVVAPFSTVDLATAHGDSIEIEERDSDEITHFAGKLIAPAGVRGGNPAFDVTPNELITAIITEHGVIRQPFQVNLRRLANRLAVAARPQRRR
jgi:methylthioribose-1-phosphate isomerase